MRNLLLQDEKLAYEELSKILTTVYGSKPLHYFAMLSCSVTDIPPDVQPVTYGAYGKKAKFMGRLTDKTCKIDSCLFLEAKDKKGVA